MPSSPGAAAAQEVSRADDAFGSRLFGPLGSGGGNVVFSPASVAASLRMALLGARGETAAQLAGALGVPGRREAADGLRVLSAWLPEAAGGQQSAVRAPTTVWVQSGLDLVPEFADAVSSAAAGSLRRADFRAAPGEAAAAINRVIAEQTSGRIRALIPPGALDPLARLVLAGAVHLKAAWAFPFPPAATSQAPFHLAGGRETRAPMMRLRRAERLGHVRGEGYQAVVLPFSGRRLAMSVLLPDGALPPLEEKLAREGTAGLLAGARPEPVRLAMPRFRMTTALSLRPALESLGVTLAFGAGADFSGVTTAEPLAVSEAAHQALVTVDERGAEAAAATAATARAISATTRAPVEVTVDRPFLFAITDTAAGLPLFLGRVADPTAG